VPYQSERVNLLIAIERAANAVPTGGPLTDLGHIALVLAALHSFSKEFLEHPDSEGRARLQEVLRLLA
jgi:hypothetical protein